MTAAQRAITAAKALPMFEAAAKQRMSAGGKKKGGADSPTHRARTDAAAVFKVGEKAVQQAKALLADAPDLARQVTDCALSVAAAYQQLQQRQERQRQEAKDTEADRFARVLPTCDGWPGASTPIPDTAGRLDRVIPRY
jgi:molecular chaperone GrpE (heat shock protein)